MSSYKLKKMDLNIRKYIQEENITELKKYCFSPDNKKIFTETPALRLNYLNISILMELIIHIYSKNIIEMLRILLGFGIDINTVLGKYNLFNYAIRHKNKDLIKFILSVNPLIINVGYSSLVTAIESQDEDLIKILISHSIKYVAEEGPQPITVAVKMNMVELVNVMLEDTEIQKLITNSVNPPIMYDNQTLLFIACHNNNLEMVKLLLGNDFFKNNTANFNKTHRTYCLIDICKSSYEPTGEKTKAQTEIAKLLLTSIEEDLSKDMLLESETYVISYLPHVLGITPLIYACRNGNHNLVKVLLEKIVELNMEKEVINMACESYINVTYNKNMTPLMIACEAGHSEIVKLLLAIPTIDMYVETIPHTHLHEKEKKTALLIALENGNVDCVKALLEAKYNVNRKLRSRKETEILEEKIYPRSEWGGGGGVEVNNESDSSNNDNVMGMERTNTYSVNDARNKEYAIGILELLLSPFTFALAKENPPEVRHEMVKLLLEYGADPRENQVVPMNICNTNALILAKYRMKEAKAKDEEEGGGGRAVVKKTQEEQTCSLLEIHLSYWRPIIHFRCTRSNTIITTVLLVGVRQDNIKNAFLDLVESGEREEQSIEHFSSLPNEIILLILGFLTLSDITARNSFTGGVKSPKSTKKINKAEIFIKNVLKEKENTYGLEENDISYLSYILMNMKPEGLKQNIRFKECMKKVEIVQKHTQRTTQKTAQRTTQRTAQRTAQRKESKSTPRSIYPKKITKKKTA